ncbi:MAG: hypothetical protein ACRCY3_01580 [Sphingorhabdus sp.]
MILRPEYRSYDCAGLAEHVLCFGTGLARQILIVPPLFDEMNRVRRMLARAMRLLTERDVGSMLIDLPGCNESAADLSQQSLTSWTQATGMAASQLGATHIASLRGGALVDHENMILPHWRLAPAKGASLRKTMIRTRIAGDREAGRTSTEATLLAEAQSGQVELAGNILGADMVADLESAVPRPVPQLTVRNLGTDIEGAPLWLRTEPQDDPAMSAAIAADLAAWSAE